MSGLEFREEHTVFLEFILAPLSSRGHEDLVLVDRLLHPSSKLTIAGTKSCTTTRTACPVTVHFLTHVMRILMGTTAGYSFVFSVLYAV